MSDNCVPEMKKTHNVIRRSAESELTCGQKRHSQWEKVTNQLHCLRDTAPPLVLGFISTVYSSAYT